MLWRQLGLLQKTPAEGLLISQADMPQANPSPAALGQSGVPRGPGARAAEVQSRDLQKGEGARWNML